MISNQPRGRRQSAVRLFAREFYESSLPDGGQGEYDPKFVVTKLGAKVNRMYVAGVIAVYYTHLRAHETLRYRIDRGPA